MAAVAFQAGRFAESSGEFCVRTRWLPQQQNRRTEEQQQKERYAPHFGMVSHLSFYFELSDSYPIFTATAHFLNGHLQRTAIESTDARIDPRGLH
jgi:hypothetical protein